jgi:hypothetical protein
MIRVAWPCVIAAWGMLGGYTIVVFLSLPFWMTLVLAAVIAAGIAWKLCGCDSQAQTPELRNITTLRTRSGIGAGYGAFGVERSELALFFSDRPNVSPAGLRVNTTLKFTRLDVTLSTIGASDSARDHAA